MRTEVISFSIWPGETNRRSFVLAREVLVHNLTGEFDMKSAFENLAPRLMQDPLESRDAREETVKTVRLTLPRLATPLKRGVNERGIAFLESVVKLRHPGGSRLFLFAFFFIGLITVKAASVFDDYV